MTETAAAIENLSLQLGGFALKCVDLSLAPGEILVLLGPNGAGKSLTLETVAGFHRPDRGHIVIGGRDVTRLPPERRKISLMFQDFGLFPHLSVARNIAIGLRAGRSSRRNPAQLLGDFGIAHLARRDPQQLSTGEKQRVALARALAAEPDLFLFDEPFSALDPLTRDRLRRDLDGFLRKIGVPAIFVTHDLGDAQALADRIAIMRNGAIVQSGAAAAVFETPAERFVAEFVGFDNILAGRIAARADDRLTIALAGKQIDAATRNAALDLGSAVWLCIRAEDIDLHRLGCRRTGTNRLAGRILAVAKEGMLARMTLDCGFPLQTCAMARQVRDMGLAVGAEVEAEIAPAAIHVIPAGGTGARGGRGD